MKITVLMGGTSAERDVSIASGLRIAAALRSRGHDVMSLDTAKGVIDYGDGEGTAGIRGAAGAAGPGVAGVMSRQSLSPTLGTLPEVREADVVFLALHGGQGEDGTFRRCSISPVFAIPAPDSSGARRRWTRICRNDCSATMACRPLHG